MDTLDLGQIPVGLPPYKDSENGTRYYSNNDL